MVRDTSPGGRRGLGAPHVVPGGVEGGGDGDLTRWPRVPGREGLYQYQDSWAVLGEGGTLRGSTRSCETGGGGMVSPPQDDGVILGEVHDVEAVREGCLLARTARALWWGYGAPL